MNWRHRIFPKPARFAPWLIVLAVALLAAWHSQWPDPAGHDSIMHLQKTVHLTNSYLYTPKVLPQMYQQQEARYTPLVYLVAGSLLLTTNWYAGVYGLTMLFFWTLALMGAYVLGRRYFAAEAPVWLPLAVLLAAPTMWEIGYSYNLEASLLASVLLFFALLLWSDRPRSKLSLAGSLVLSACFALSKAVFAVIALPAGALFCLTEKRPANRRGLAIVLTATVTAAVWFLTHRQKYAPELAFDLYNEAWNPGPLYYPLLLLVGYRSLPLLAAAFWLGVRLYRQKAFTRRDLAFAAWFAVPLIFYLMIGTKRAWYILPAYAALPVWLLDGARRLWDAAPVRRVVKGLAWFYVLLALVNCVLIGVVIRHPNWSDREFAGFHVPVLPTARQKEVAAVITAQLQAHPNYRVALDARGLGADVSHLGQLFILAEPRLTAVDKLLVTDEIRNHLSIFVADLENRGVLYTLAPDWPTIDPDGFEFPDPKFDMVAIAQKLASLRTQFEPAKPLTLADGTKISAFVNRNLKATLVSNPLYLYDRLTEQIRRAESAGDREAALTGIAHLRGVILPYQEAGVNLEEANLHLHFGEREKAVELLRRNLDRPIDDAPAYAFSALTLAQMAIEDGRPEEALKLIDRAPPMDDNDFRAQVLCQLAAPLVQAGQADEAEKRLLGVLPDVQGKMRGLVLIELGKFALARDDTQSAAKKFEEAKPLVNYDPVLREWLRETLLATRDGTYKAPTNEAQQ